MKDRFLKILTLLVFMTSVLMAQEDDKIIVNLKVTDTGFNEFAELLLKDYDVRLYFSTDWVKGLKITTDGKPKALEDFLDDVLPIGLSYYYNGNKQVFISRAEEPIEE